tara:strand:- start:65 stop:1108 length:1044 start_codon:yes stop_codon:yes gene_type:complete
MTIDKKINYVMQGGVKNYLGKQKEIKAPIKWKSSPDHPETELAYITKAEKNLLVKKDLHGSLKGGVNRGPSGIMSLNGFGSNDPDQNVSGSQMSAAETGDFSGFSGTGVPASQGGTELPPGVDRVPTQLAKDIRSAAINAGAGQRVNPGFFDSRNTISPAELQMAETYRQDPTNTFAQGAYKKTRSRGIMDFITSGGLIGAGIRGLGQRFGLGKKYNEPTYDMSEFNNLGLYGVNPASLDFNPDARIQDTSFIEETGSMVPIFPKKKPNVVDPSIIDVGYGDPAFENDLMAKLSTKGTIEYNKLNNKKLQNEATDGITPPLTLEEEEKLKELEIQKNEASLTTSMYS